MALDEFEKGFTSERLTEVFSEVRLGPCLALRDLCWMIETMLDTVYMLGCPSGSHDQHGLCFSSQKESGQLLKPGCCVRRA